MDKLYLHSRAPRILKFRHLYRWYLAFLMLICLVYTCYFSYILWIKNIPIDIFFEQYRLEICSGFFNFVLGIFYSIYAWKKSSLVSSQIFEDKIVFNFVDEKTEYLISEIIEIKHIWRSHFYLKFKSGEKVFFSSMLERVDYIWEGLFLANSTLFQSHEWFEKIRTRLVQYDHHEKRKEWFFNTKMLDIVQWLLLPVLFIMVGYTYQVQSVYIHNLETYIFRLTMFTTLSLLYCSLITSFILKKLVFDKVIKKQMAGPSVNKLRNLQNEKLLLKKGKIFQLVFSIFVFGIVIQSEVNFFSISKIKNDLAMWDLPKGKTIFIDNRFNCLSCHYSVVEGDKIIFGKGFVGMIMALEGETIAYVKENQTGRSVASEDTIEVPSKHVFVKIGPKNEDFVMVKETDLIGKIKTP